MQQQKKRKPQEVVHPRKIGSVPSVTREQTATIMPTPEALVKVRAHLAETGAAEAFVSLRAVVMWFTPDMGGGSEPPVSEPPMAWCWGTFDTFEEAFEKIHEPDATNRAVATVTMDSVTITVV